MGFPVQGGVSPPPFWTLTQEVLCFRNQINFLSTHQVLSGKFPEQNLLSTVAQILFLPKSCLHHSKCWTTELFVLVSEECKELPNFRRIKWDWNSRSLAVSYSANFSPLEDSLAERIHCLRQRLVGIELGGTPKEVVIWSLVLVVWTSLVSVYMLIKFLGKTLEYQKICKLRFVN